MWKRWSVTVTGAALVVAVAMGAPRQDPGAVAAELAWRVERLRATGSLPIGGEVVRASELILNVYERRGFQPLWDGAGVDSLLLTLAQVSADGLHPDDYHRAAIAAAHTRKSERSTSARDAAELDLLSTEAFARLAHDLRFGKTKPSGPTSDADAHWPFGGPDGAAHLAETVSTRRVREGLLALRPAHFVYGGLMDALAELRGIESQGGWDSIPHGRPLQVDSVDARVPLLRKRLVMSGDLTTPNGAHGLRFDTALEAAVRSFQHRHGLNEDGIVGEGTRVALNVSVERRIEQVRVNLERARWIAHGLPDRYVAVNVAGALVYVLEGDRIAFQTRAVVGSGFTQTPVFTAAMLYVELNPYWTVPEGIVGEILDLIAREPGYLERHSMRVLDASGRPVDASMIDFGSYSAKSFPYVFRQEPGPLNPLGRIKLMFPNEHRVYLHDTPARELFAREVRLFSHGCIRVEDPLGLAEIVLGEPERWNRATLRSIIDEGVTRTIPLAEPIDVFVLYWTAAVDVDGELHFHKDVYDRDGAVLRGLDGASGTRAPEST